MDEFSYASDAEIALRSDDVQDDLLAKILVRDIYSTLFQLNHAISRNHLLAGEIALSAIREGIQRRRQFQGQTSPRAWLAGFAIKELNKRKREWGSEPASGEEIRLPKKDLLPLILHILSNFSVPEIGFLIRKRDTRVPRKIVGAWKRVWGQSNLGAASIHRLQKNKIETLAAGLLDESENIDLEAHLADCPGCRKYHTEISETTGKFRAQLAAGYPQPNLSSNQIDLYAKALRSTVSSNTGTRFKIRGETAWIGVLAVVVFAAVITFNRSPEAEQGRDLFATIPPTSVPTPFPASFAAGERAEGPPPIQQLSWNPRISSDGEWVVFESNANTLLPKDTNAHSDIFLINRESETIERLSVNADGVEGDGDSRSPDISGDGRWVVFDSDASNLAQGDNDVCLGEAGYRNCSDIFLLDRDTDIIQKISSSKRLFPLGDSIQPSISDDGRFVAYWSTDGWLVDEKEENSQRPYGVQSCADVFIYDHMTGNTERIEVGRQLGFEENFPSLSISRRGIWLVLTVSSEDLIAKSLGVFEGTQVFAVNVESGQFQPVNISSWGITGDGDSSLGIIDDLGRWVAFASDSTNLVPNDTNGVFDIFVHDLFSGETEMVSRAVFGENTASIEDSELLEAFEPSLDISPGGRFVAFSSAGPSLNVSYSTTCPTEFLARCVELFVYDRNTGETNRVAFDQEKMSILGQDLPMLLQPAITDDGTQVVFTAVSLHCSDGPFCMDVFDWDTATGQTSQLSRRMVSDASFSPGWVENGSVRSGSDWANDVAFSADGRFLASAHRENLYIHLEPDWQLLYTLVVHEAPVTSVAFSPILEDDGTVMLASGDQENNVIVWSLTETGRKIRFILVDHPGPVFSLDFSPDGEFLAVGTLRGTWVWALGNGSITRIAEFEGDRANEVAFSPDGKYLAIAQGDGSTWVYTFPEDEVAFRLGGHDDQVLAVDFSPDGQYIATGARDGRALLWKLTKAEDGTISPVPEFQFDHEDWVKTVAFSADSQVLATGGYDSNLNLWQAADGNYIQALKQGFQDQILSINFSPDGNTLAVGSVRSGLQVWEVEKITTPTEVDTSIQPDLFTRQLEDEFIWEEVVDASDLADRLAEESAPLDFDLLYNAQDALAYNISAPEFIPSGYVFEGASYIFNPIPEFDLGILLQYTNELDQPVPGTITFYQISAEAEDYLPFSEIGKESGIDTIPIGRPEGEYVEGGWKQETTTDRLSDTQIKIIRRQVWDPNYPTKTLIWREGNYIFGIQYSILEAFMEGSDPSITETDIANFGVTQDEIVEMALSVVDTTVPERTEVLLFEYEIQLGDTCTWIADLFATSIGAIQQHNALDNCENIIAGQTLQIPLPSQREEFAIEDISCSGKPERVQLIPHPFSLVEREFQPLTAGFVVEILGDNGIFHPIAEHHLNASETGYSKIELFTPDGCLYWIAAEKIYSEGMDIFTWDGTALNQIIEGPGGQLIAPPFSSFPYTFSIEDIVTDRFTSTCLQITYTYEWDGESIFSGPPDTQPIECKGD